MRGVRTRLWVAVAAAVASLLFAGCGGSGSTASSGKPAAGGSATYAIDTAPTCFDLHVNAQDVTAEIGRNVVDSLVSAAPDGTFHPWLASSWQITPDLRSFTFHLRTGVTFSDGTPFDAAAVKANFDRIANPATKSRYAASLLGPYTGTQVVDARTVTVRFSRAFAPFLPAASTAYLGFYSPKTLAANADKLCGGGPVMVGTGPFTFERYTKNQSIVLRRNPAYRWPADGSRHVGPAYLDTVTFRILPENSVRVGALQSRQADIARALPPVNVSAVRADRRLSVVRANQPGEVYSIYLNTTRAPFDDVRVRRAVQLGVDIDADVRTVYFGQYDRAWSPLSPTSPGYDSALVNTWRFDPAAAGRLLDQAGWTGRDAQGFRTKGGKRLTLVWPLPPREIIREQRDVLGQAFQADLKKIGIEVTRPGLDLGEYATRGAAGEFQMSDLAWTRFDPDILRLFFNSASRPPSGQNASFLHDADVDAWTLSGAATTDQARRAQFYRQVQQRVVTQAAVVPVYVETTLLGVNRRVHDLGIDPNGWTSFHDVWVTGG
ncbi:peptide/nickel transport system substrate-binding protein [Frankia sp. AiPs1]|uniref:ABC transporter substrate-binding protein n=1 Tax=Frankia sp. AiPa1 TaxID=573492 RepID=UPI00202AFBB5|nr:ABC transporter substrate-binding protein [Frankia sp. AiPa1]MCL9762476.1 ABC transporter substrate-binding protein [Frankia sp. AiPa1]